jgi:ankyrin repeat protein
VNGYESNISLLRDSGFDVNFISTDVGLAALPVAVETGHDAVVNLLLELLEKNATIHLSSREITANSAHKAIMKLLTEEDANINTSLKVKVYGGTIKI